MTSNSPAQRWVLALASIASLMVALDALVVTTALPTIQSSLDASLAQLEWTVNAYALPFAVLLMAGAALGDRFGRRRVFVAGQVVFVAASAACSLAPDAGALIAARAVQGAGAALVMPSALSLLGAAFPPQARAKALGIFSGVTGLAVLGGPVVGGVIAEGLDWEWIFWLNLPIGAIVVPLAFARIEGSTGPARPLDLPGMALLGGASLGVVWALVRGNEAGWGSAEVIGTLVVGLALGVAFVAWELRARAPMLPLTLFGSRAFSSGNAAAFFLYSSLYGIVFFMAQFLQHGLGYGPLGTGVRLLPWTATLFIVAPLAGARLKRFGERPFIAVGLLLHAAGMTWLALIADADMSYGSLVAPLIIGGTGLSMAMPAVQTAVMGAVAPQDIGKASGTFSTLRQLGGAFGVAVLVAVFASAGSYGSASAFVDGFAPALGIGAAFGAAGAVAGLLLPGRRIAPAAVAPTPEPEPAR